MAQQRRDTAELARSAPTRSGDRAATLLLQRLHDVGFDDIVQLDISMEGMAAISGFATQRSGNVVFVKTFGEARGDDIFTLEAAGLHVLRQTGGFTTPDVVVVSPDVLVLSVLQPRPTTAAFWERVAHALARMHMSTLSERYGWAHDNWLGRSRQHNGWDDNGFRFFAEQRVLRWLPEARVQVKLDREDRRALERLCDRLPDLLPVQRACLTHGDFWVQNILATVDGEAATIDPAVSFMWADVDLSHLWCSPHPPEAQRFFDVYGEVTSREPGWRDRLPLLHVRQHMALMAMYDHDWGSTAAVRRLVAPFRTR